MGTWLQDLRYGLRALAKAPTLTLVALLSLGVGIGSVATVYTWTDRFLLRPLPGVEEPIRLVMAKTKGPGGAEWSVSYPNYRDWAVMNAVFEGLAVKTMEQVGVREPSEQGVERAWSLLVSGNYFDVLGARAWLGRSFRPDDEAEAAQVAVLGHSYWQRRFGGDSSVVGRTLVVNGQAFAVVGIMPAKFGGSYVGLDLDMYLPITTRPALLGGTNRLIDRGSSFLEGIGRLKPGVTLLAAQEDMRRVGRELSKVHPDDATEALLSGVRDQGPPATMKPIFGVLLAVTALVLLIACANVANLLLVRAQTRQKELGVRLAIGAGRGRIVRQLMAESVLLAAGAGLAGMFFTTVGRGLLVGLIPPTPFPVRMSFETTWQIVLFTAALAASTVFFFGLWPAVRASRTDLVTVLKSAATGSPERDRARRGLVAVQVGLATVSLVTAGLFLRAMDRATTIDAGFEDPATLLLVDTDLTIAGIRDSTGVETVARLVDRLRAVPGVRAASFATFVPLGWSCCSSRTAEIEGYTPEPNENLSINYSRVGSSYFGTMGIDLVSGRDFTDADRAEAPRVMVVNETFAKRYWPGRDPLGRRVRQSGAWWTVVGVANDGHYRNLVDTPFPLIYVPWRQNFDASVTIHVRTAGDPRAAIAALRTEFAATNVGLPFLDPRTMVDHMGQSTIGQGIGAKMLALFGFLAMFLAGVGIYGVMSYTVAQRTREIGIRVALGASLGGVARLVVRQAMIVTALGVLLGGVVAIGVGTLVRGVLLGVSPLDPITYAGIAVLLGLVAALAAVIPARRAAAIAPIVALKAD